jgi:DNA-binding NarL/FixJ family response regulator
MVRVFVADSLSEEHSALRLLLLDLKMEIVGDTYDWPSTLVLAPVSTLNMLLVDSNLLPPESENALADLRIACPNPIVIIVISHLATCKQVAFSYGADAFISKSDTPERVAERLKAAARKLSQP